MLFYLIFSLQSFGIPGPIILSLLSGALFGGVPGFITVCIVRMILRGFINWDSALLWEPPAATLCLIFSEKD